MIRGMLFFLLTVLVCFTGTGAGWAAATGKGNSPVISIAYTTNTWGQVEPIHS